MVPFTKGDIVLFPFPYTDLSHRKLRPCLVLSDEMGQDVLLCQITSRQSIKDKNVVELKQQQTIGGSLMIDSFIRSNMLFTASKHQIQRRVCKIPGSIYAQTVDRIAQLIRK